jgi:protein SCO1/2
MKQFIAGIILTGLFFSCSSGNDKTGGVLSADSGIQRLQVYYPLDTTDARGNKLYHTIPLAELISQDGKKYSTAYCHGKISVADFFFASCAGTCPRMTTQLTRVQKAFAGNPDFKIISYSVDPARDSAQALMEYAKRFHADTAQWKFITGPKKTLYDLARYGYYLPVEPGSGDSEDFIHSEQLILVDRQSHIRGYYSGTDSASVDNLIVDIKTLLNEK